MSERVPPTLDGLVSAARRDGPPASTLARIADGAAARSAALAPAPRSAFLEKVTRPRTAIAIAVVSTAALGLLATTGRDDARRRDQASAAEPSVPVQVESRVPEPAARAPESASEIPTVDVRSLPASKSAPSEARKGGGAPANTAIRAPEEEENEGALLHRAHAAIASEPEKALALTAEHERRFPSGLLVQEREVIAIEALARLGRLEQARAHAATFSSTYPRSAYRRRVDEAIGGAR